MCKRDLAPDHPNPHHHPPKGRSPYLRAHNTWGTRRACLALETLEEMGTGRGSARAQLGAGALGTPKSNTVRERW